MLAALDAGVSSFMTKPVNWSLFEGHIRHLLHSSQEIIKSSEALDVMSRGNAEKDAIFARLTAAVLPLLQRASQDRDLAPAAAEALALMSDYQRIAAALQSSEQTEEYAERRHVRLECLVLRQALSVC